MDKRTKQVLGLTGIIAVVFFPVLYASEIGQALDISPINAALLIIIIYFALGKSWKYRDKFTG